MTRPPANHVVWTTVLASLMSALTSLAAPTLQVDCESASLFIHELFTLRIMTDAEEEFTLSDTPDIPGFILTDISDTFSVQHQGAMWQAMRLDLIPEQMGALTLPPISFTVGNDQLKTPSVRVTVSQPRPATEMALEIALSETNLVAGQPLRMDVTWTSPIPLTRCKELLLQIPLLDDPNWQAFPIMPEVPEDQRIGLPVNSQRVIGIQSKDDAGEHVRFSIMLVPQTSGQYTAWAGLNCALLRKAGRQNSYPSYFDNQFFHRPDSDEAFERVFLTPSTTALTVRALHDTSRNAYFHGLVGPCSLSTTITPADCIVGQILHLTVTLDGIPFGEHLPSLPEATLNALEPYFRISRTPIETRNSDRRRSETYIVRPLHTGITRVPGFALQVYTPESGTYTMVRSDPMPLTVRPDGKLTTFQPHADAQRTVKKPLPGIRQNQHDTHQRHPMNTLLNTLADYWWIFWAAPPLMWLALRPWIKHRDRCRTDPVYARASSALKRFQQRQAADEEHAWRHYLADRFNLVPQSMTRDTIRHELDQLDIDSALKDAIIRRFAYQDTKEYARPGTEAPPATPTAALVGRIEAATRALLLILLCVLPMADSLAATPAEQFDAALESRMEKPDEAHLLFTEAALGFEEQDAHLNAANSWFFAGNAGRALANFRKAEQLHPFNRQIQESMTLIRSQRKDHFQGMDDAGNLISRSWNRLLCWRPSLRMGVLTLGYLVACLLYGVSRVVGWRIPVGITLGFSIPAAIVLLSLLTSVARPAEGVILEQTDARLGPGFAYDAAYETILHEGTEFQQLDQKNGWLHIRLPDGQDAWVQATACMML